MSGNAHQRRIARRRMVDVVHRMPDGSGFLAHMGVNRERLPKGHQRVVEKYALRIPSGRRGGKS